MIRRLRVRRVVRACAGLLLLAVLSLLMAATPSSLKVVDGSTVMTEDTVACCLPDGTCQDLTEAACLVAGGIAYADGRSCAVANCSIGACSLPDGTCDDTSIAECLAQGGLWHGAGSTCAEASPSGACWLPDDTCIDTSAYACDLQGGIWQGAGTDCAGSPIPTGACCLGDGSVDQLTEAACLLKGGYYAGDGTEAATFDCTQGVCCISGSCFADGPFGSNPLTCQIYGGVWQVGVDTCDGIECAVLPAPTPTATATPVPDPTGACCLPDGSCDEVTLAECLIQGGLYRGDDTSCDVIECDMGACCLDDGTCAELSRVDCAAAGGQYGGAGTTCAQVDCAVGACCLPDGSCTSSTAESCASRGGSYQGDGAPCSDCPLLPPVPRGACLLPSGECTTSTAANCELGFGIYLGDGSDCSTRNELGACCLPDDSCVMTSTFECFLSEGQPQGPGVLCQDTYCLPPIGACCLEDGSCSELTEQACQAAFGTWGGAETTCALAICSPVPVGACCLPSGECDQLTQIACETVLGTWQGAEIDCATVDCVAQPLGACQLGAYTQLDPRRCEITYQVACEAQYGAYQGDDTRCTLEASTPITMTASASPPIIPESGPVVVTSEILNDTNDLVSILSVVANIPALPGVAYNCTLPARIQVGDNWVCQLSGMPIGPSGQWITGTVTAIVMDGLENVYLVNANLSGEPYDLTLVKNDREDPWFAGWNLGYDIRVINSGYLTLTQIIITDTVPLPWSNVRGAMGVTQTVWTIDRLGPGASKELELEIQTRRTIPDRTILTNILTASALQLQEQVTTTEATLFLVGPTPINSPTPAPSPTPRGYSLLPMIMLSR